MAGRDMYRRTGLTAAKPEWLKGRNVLIVDSSEDVRCGARRQCYILHYSLDLFTPDAQEFLVTDISTGERLSNFTDIKKGDIVVGNRACGDLPATIPIQDVPTRYPETGPAGVFRPMSPGPRIPGKSAHGDPQPGFPKPSHHAVPYAMI